LQKSQHLINGFSPMGKYLKLSPPKRGSKITVAKNGQLQVPDDPIVPFIQGEGMSANIWSPVREVLERAVDRCYANAKRLEWLEVFAGERAHAIYGAGEWLPDDTVRALQEYKVCIKGPLASPVGASAPLDDGLREKLDLFAHVQPIRYMEGSPSPLKQPETLDLRVFREHTEDVFCELEWKKGSAEAKQIIGLVNDDLGKKLDRSVRPDSSIGLKPISATATKRLLRLALDFAVKNKRRSITFVHEGGVMRHTEGFFRDWGYEIARKEFGDATITEAEVDERHDGEPPRGRVVVRDRSSERVFQELLTDPGDYDVVATTNLNGAFLEAVALAAVGSVGIAPNAFVGAKAAIFEATHGDRPKASRGEHENPASALLCGVMLFEHLGWKDAADLVGAALAKTISEKAVTPDLAQHLEGAQVLTTGDFCARLVDNFEAVHKDRVQQVLKSRAVSGAS
jgi:isocitrate dehydrogenase